MPYNPKGFGDVAEKATMAPSELQPPLNFADGGAVNWAGDSTVYNTQSQIGNMMATPGGFGSMASQFTQSPPFGKTQDQSSGQQDQNQTQDQGQGFDFNLGTILQPMPPVPPPPNPTVGSFSSDPFNSIAPPLSGGNTVPPAMDMPAPEAAMAKGGNVSNLINRLKGEFSNRGLDFDRVMAQRLANKGQRGDTMLAHINPQEAQMLKQAGGSGKINPHTGLPAFDNPSMGDYGGDDSESDYSGGGNDGSGSGNNDYTGGAGGGGGGYDLGNGYKITDDGDVVPTNTGGGGGGDGASYRSSSPSFRSSENASMDAYDSIMRTSPSALMSDTNRAFMQDMSARNQAAIDAMKNEAASNQSYDTQRSLALQGLANLPVENAILTKSPVVAAKEALDRAALTYRGTNPNEATGEDTGEFETQPASMAFRAYNQVKTVPTSPFDSVVKSVVGGDILHDRPPVVSVQTAQSPNVTTPVATTSPLKAASTPAPVPKAAEPAAKPAPTPTATPTAVATPATIPVPVPRPYDLNVPASATAVPATPAFTAVKSPVASPLRTATTPTPPADIPPADTTQPTETEKSTGFFSDIFSPKNLTNAAVSIFPGFGLINALAKLTGNPTMGDIVARSGQPYTTTSQTNELLSSGKPAPGVPLPPIPDRDMGAGTMMDTVLKPLGLDTESQINNMAKRYTDLGMSDTEAYNRASYDFRQQQMQAATGTGRGGGTGEMISPLSTYRRPGMAAQRTPETTTPVAPIWSRAYTPTITNYSLYGYGPEGSYYNYAKGGSVGPLGKTRK